MSAENVCRERIKEIQGRIKESHSDVLDSLAGAIDRLEKAFPGQWHFLMEFIQNADDAQSDSISIEISQNEIQVLNDGKMFDGRDVESVCKVGRSSKTYTEKGEDYIGYLGVGFKSVFLISDNPQIYSGGCRFEFDKNAWDQHEGIPWQVYPLWISDETRTVLRNGYTTGFRIPLSESVNDEMVEKLIEEVSAEQISDRTLLFLRNLEEIIVKDRIRETTKRLKKTCTVSSKEYEIYRIQVYIDGELSHVNSWLVFKNTCDIPPKVKSDPITEWWERDNLQTREVMVGFRLDEHQQLTKEEGTAHMGVFSFLPLKEVPSGLNFLVQADFLTAPGREVIHREAEWNKWLAEEVYNLLKNETIPVFKQHDSWKYSFTDVLYPADGGHEIFNEKIHKPLQNHLRNQPVLLNRIGKFSQPKNTVEIGLSAELQQQITESDLDSLYPDKDVLHPDCEIPHEIGRKVVDGPNFNSNGANRDFQELLELRAEDRGFLFFTTLYKELNGYADSTLSGSSLKRQAIVLTESLKVRKPTAAYFLSADVEIPEGYSDQFPLVHRLVASKPSRELLETLGVNKITEKEIQRVLNAEAVPEDEEEWQSLDDREKIRKTRVCKDLWAENQLQARDLSFLTLKTSTGEWKKPAQVLFPSEYSPEHSIEELVEFGLTDIKPPFLSTEYLHDDDREGWNGFFESLGIEQEVDKKGISEAVAVNTALEFERENGRDARPLASHEERSDMTGYDIKSEDGERLIEVKGRKAESPSVNLTSNQFGRLKENDEKYYIYIVQNALDEPKLCVLKGSDVVEDQDWSIQIRYSNWSPKTRDDYRPL